MIKSHAELESFHYKALSNQSYAIEGMMDVIREEILLNQPVFPVIEQPQRATDNQALNVAHKALILAQEERKDRQQLEIDVASLKKNYHTHTDKKSKYKSYT